MKKEGEKNVKLQLDILLRTVLPMLLMAVLIAAAAMFSAGASMEKELFSSLDAVASTVAAGYDELYPGDYKARQDSSTFYLFKGDKEVTGRYVYIDRIAEESGMEISLLWQDARIITTVKDKDGVRYIGSGVNSYVYTEMKTKQRILHYDNVLIGNEGYFVSYLPLFNQDGSFVGMVGTAKPSSEVKKEKWSAAGPILFITVLGLLVAAFISIRYTNAMVADIDRIQAFLSGMVSGKLDNEMPDSVLKRKDEIGVTAGDVTRMQNAVRILIECDPLTTLYNRRSGDARFKKLQRRSDQTGLPFAVALGDIDFFKKVNDTYGHDAGDIVLKYVAKELKDLMAGRGFAVRWGGEEFLLVFEEMTLVAAAASIEDFLDRIRAATLHHDGNVIRITMSVGLVEGAPGLSADDMIKAADEKLYYGKEHGRNQLVVTPGEEQPDYRELLKQQSGRTETVITFAEEYLDSENLMQLLSDNALRDIENGDEE
ncbi:MAG: diguanylate cyclase [Lachnospiraceae bacterium]|nr:diguanylate cyclase [Lachnospiraceae bacterium]